MSYFDAQLGQRPIDHPDPAKTIPARSPEQPAISPFGATLGPAPRAQTHAIPDAEGDMEVLAVHCSTPPMSCPLCRGILEEEAGIWHCRGRCRARWVEDTPGALLDIAGLPFGVCRCCPRPRPLLRTEGGAVCPDSALEYLLLPEGPRPRVEAAPLGLCLCCAPPMPLIVHEGALVCRARPANRYSRSEGRIIPAPAAQGASSAETLAAIDTALRRNSARVAVNGLFDLD